MGAMWNFLTGRGRASDLELRTSFDDVFGQMPFTVTTESGKKISERTALMYSVVWRSAALIADAVASLPPHAYREDDSGQQIPANLPPWIRNPSLDKHITRYDVWHQMMISVLLWGNAYALLIKRPSDGAIGGLLLLDPARVNCQWVLDPIGKPTPYRRYQVDGGPWLTSDQIFHIQGMTLPGQPMGMSVVRQAREAIGLGLTLEQFGARYFQNGSMAKVVIVAPGVATGASNNKDDTLGNIVRNYERFHRGPGNWHRPAVLTGPVGTKIENISIPPEDAQFLQTREFQALDVARWFGVPPHRVGIMTNQTSWGTGLAEENTALVQSTYRRYILAIEGMFTTYCTGGAETGLMIRLDDSTLLRGTIKDQVTTWTQAVKGQIITPNEARSRLGFPPIEGGDSLVQYISPSSKMPTEQPNPADQPDPNADQAAGSDTTTDPAAAGATAKPKTTGGSNGSK